ncbi:MAG: type IV prepilin peptidase/methyltransferase PilD [Candidatus Pelagadaptatus aseana]|uniref:prepilin peptidase n=1 Tax=Candidatus Pelagadaptatus aseana TaxID=3120508 RepID=UPI0039B2AA16
MNDFIAAGGNTGFLIFSITLLGLVVGSFLNVVIHRVPLMMQNSWKRDCCELLQQPAPDIKKISLVYPNSRCPSCEAPIRAWQNIPVISYLFLGGKCANCKTSISKRYPIIELVTGILSGFLAYTFGPTEQLLYTLILTWALISLTMIDIDHQLLPDNITLPLLWLGIIANISGTFTDLESSILGAIFGYLSLWFVYWLFKLVTGKEGMGFGDFKLLAALGAWMGWQALPQIIILSSVVGAVIGIAGILIQGRDKNVAIPFGPYLAIAGWIALIWGEQITAAYLQYAGLA